MKKFHKQPNPDFDALIVIILCSLFALAVWGGLIYTFFHFVFKYW